jgi:hypothetical protein
VPLECCPCRIKSLDLRLKSTSNPTFRTRLKRSCGPSNRCKSSSALPLQLPFCSPECQVRIITPGGWFAPCRSKGNLTGFEVSATSACDAPSLRLRFEEDFLAPYGDSWADFSEGKVARVKGSSDQMKVKSFTYERSWTGKYYRQRLLPCRPWTRILQAC